MAGKDEEMYMVCVLRGDGGINNAGGHPFSYEEAVKCKDRMIFFGCRLPLVICTYEEYMEKLGVDN